MITISRAAIPPETETQRTYPALALGWEVSRAGQSIVHDIIGGGIAITSLGTRPRSGTLRLFYMDEATAAAALQLHAPAAVFSFLDDVVAGAWKNMTYVVDVGGCRLTLDDTTRKRWVLEVNYQELQESPL